MHRDPSIDLAADAADIILTAAMRHRSRVVRVDPADSSTFKVLFYRHGRTCASAFLPADLGAAVVQRLRMLAELEPLDQRRQTGGFTVVDQLGETRLFCTSSGHGAGARAELWLLHAGEDMPDVEGLATLAPLEVGDVVGQFRITGYLGEGGSGVVYRAHHVWLDRACALKVLRPEGIHDPEVMESFYREARLAALAENHDTVAISDVGTLPDGRPYLVMELMAGRSLADVLLSDGPLEPHRAIYLARELAAALVDLHQHGIYHCDITPANVFVSGTPYAETVKIGDFGSARDDHQPALRDVVRGTPLYMAPEQVRGLRCDARTDLYALGCVFYQMIAGETPFDGSSPHELAHKHVSAKVPPIHTPFEVLPGGVEQIIRCLLQKEPARRFPSAAALLEALGHVLSRTNRSTVRLWWQANA